MLQEKKIESEITKIGPLNFLARERETLEKFLPGLDARLAESPLEDLLVYMGLEGAIP